MTETRAGRQIYCVVMDKYGYSIQSNVITLIMGNAAKIVEQPQNAAAQVGEEATVTLKTSGYGITYQW